MNIAYILNSTLPLGGATKAFRSLLGGLMQKGVEPVVVVPDKNGIYQDLVAMKIPVYVLTYRPQTYPKARTAKDVLLFVPRMLARTFVNRRSARKLPGILRRHNIKLIHTNTGVTSIGLPAARELGIPHIYHLREYGDLDFGYHYMPLKSCLRRQLAAEQSFSICITKDIQQHHGQKESANSRVIYDGIRPALPSMPEADKQRSYFLFAGRLEPAKGLDQLLCAYADYAGTADRPLPLLVAGSTANRSYTAAQQQYIADHHLDTLVTLLGERSDLDLLMRNARVLIIPSRNEGFGFCMPEAMFQGCLAIGRNTGGTKEQMDNGLEMEGAEIALRYDTAAELAELLLSVGRQPEDSFTPYRERAFRVVNKLYTAESSSAQVYQFYKDILHGTNS